MNSGTLGFIAGYISGGDDQPVADTSTLQGLQAELRRRQRAAWYQQALKQGAAELHFVLIDELRDISKGRPPLRRRLSDPANQAGRNECFSRYVASALARISEGSWVLGDDAIRALANRRVVK